MQNPPKPELMSPAGYWPELQTAIESGADAVYFGLNHFTARAKVGFSLEELPEVFQTLHQRGVKGFVTFNTLVFDHEFEQAESDQSNRRRRSRCSNRPRHRRRSTDQSRGAGP